MKEKEIVHIHSSSIILEAPSKCYICYKCNPLLLLFIMIALVKFPNQSSKDRRDNLIVKGRNTP